MTRTSSEISKQSEKTIKRLLSRSYFLHLRPIAKRKDGKKSLVWLAHISTPNPRDGIPGMWQGWSGESRDINQAIQKATEKLKEHV